MCTKSYKIVMKRDTDWRGGDATGNCRRIFDQNKSCSKSYLNPKLIYRKSATLKRWRLTVKKHNKTVKTVVFCIVWRHTVCKPNVVQHWVLAHSKEGHFYYMNHQRTFHLHLFQNLQDFYFEGLRNGIFKYTQITFKVFIQAVCEPWRFMADI